MNKLAIMFVMLLGSVATMQAQSFDFSCAEAGPSAEEIAFGFDRDQAPLFTAEDIEMIPAGFVQGGASSDLEGDNGRVIDVNHYAYVIYLNGTTADDCPRCNLTRVTIDAEDNGYVVSVGIPPVPSAPYLSFADAMVFANAQIAFITGEFVEAQEIVLEDSSFALDPQFNFSVWSRNIFTSETYEAQAEITIYNGQFRANVNGEGRMDFDTLQEAMDFISSFIYTAN